MTFLVLAAIALTSIVLTVQSAYTLYMMVYTWDRPDAYERARAPREFAPPTKSFTVMLPARHEQAVIAQTIEHVVNANYPLQLLQVLVICSEDDTETIEAALGKIEELQDSGRDIVDVVVFNDQPVNKPHGLNVALRYSDSDVVTIFDAEDDIHPDIFNVINTVMVEEGVKVIQSGVQLMNYQSRWFSTLNVLEYFFWFRSRLHFQADAGALPLGGNTVFFSRDVLQGVGGWDESNLTEDADIGIRISLTGERIRVIYDDEYVTREETPPTLTQFIKQRTRWSQGFMQTLHKGEWKRMRTRKQRWLCFYTLAFPNVQALLGLYLPVSLLTTFVVHAPVLIALISYLPVLLLFAHFIVQVVGLYEFTSVHHLEASPKMVVRMAAAWFPFQLVLCYAALRALNRQLRGVRNWEKTVHTGGHREEVLSRAA